MAIYSGLVWHYLNVSFRIGIDCSTENEYNVH
jgi:hypothetical protein